MTIDVKLDVYNDVKSAEKKKSTTDLNLWLILLNTQNEKKIIRFAITEAVDAKLLVCWLRLINWLSFSLRLGMFTKKIQSLFCLTYASSWCLVQFVWWIADAFLFASVFVYFTLLRLLVTLFVAILTHTISSVETVFAYTLNRRKWNNNGKPKKSTQLIISRFATATHLMSLIFWIMFRFLYF